MALYEDMAVPLLNGHKVRRASWFAGIHVLFVPRTKGPGDLVTDALLRALLSLTILTLDGAHRYIPHSVDRKATDWEILYGPANHPSRE